MTRTSTIRPISGFSLTEILVALTIGSMVLLGITSLFVNSSDSNRQLALAGELIENGRYALELLHDDVRHAGFYGPLSNPMTAPVALPDPCDPAAAAIQAAMPLHIQGYRAADLSSRPTLTGTSCNTGLLPPANLKPGSDIIVVRRTDTGYLDQNRFDTAVTAEVAASSPSHAEIGGWARDYIRTDAFAVEDEDSYYAITPVDGVTYMQLSAGGNFAIRVGDSDAVLNTFTNTAPTTPRPPTTAWKRVDDTSPASTEWDWNPPGDNRRVIINIYFVAPCSQGSGTNGVCTSSDDDIPTLKRLFLTRASSSPSSDPEPAFELERLAEGVEYLRVEYGIDSSPSTAHGLTGFVGDGVPDSYQPNATNAANPTLAQWPNVVSARIYLLVRSASEILDHTDTKSFTLGSYAATDITAVPRADQDADTTNDHYKRQLFLSEARINNTAGRRERPTGTN